MVQSFFTKVFWGLAILGGLYAILISLLLNPWLQRHALYAHKFHTAWYHDVNRPESFGFASNQVSPFYIETPDNERLYAWHVLPLGLYAEHEDELAKSFSDDSFKKLNTITSEMLRHPAARLVINFHGNAGHVAQGWRTDIYRAVAGVESSNTHILAFDYRGFGLSTGSPTESGLVTDGIAVVNWAMREAKVPPERIVLLGQSLGTAVATAVAEHFVSREKPVEFAGLVLVSGFSDIPNLMKSYKIGGIIPILSPLRPYPSLQNFFSENIQDTWETASRLTSLSGKSEKLRLTIIHARNDFDIGWKHSDLLLRAALSGREKFNHVRGKYDITAHRLNFDDDPINVFEADHTVIRQELLNHGGHNRLNTFAPVALAVHRAFVAQ